MGGRNVDTYRLDAVTGGAEMTEKQTIFLEQVPGDPGNYVGVNLLAYGAAQIYVGHETFNTSREALVRMAKAILDACDGQ